MSSRSIFEELLPRRLTPDEVDYLRNMIRHELPVFSTNIEVDGRRLIVDLRQPFGNWGLRTRADELIHLWENNLRHRLRELMSADIVTETSTLLNQFKNFIERQCRNDPWIDGRPREQIARGLLQAYLDARSYREVPVGSGQSDLLIFNRHGSRLLLETKIWRGPQSFLKGVKQLRVYTASENDDKAVAAAFYIIFDPTRRHQATKYVNDHSQQESDYAPAIYSVAINIDRVPPSSEG